VVKKAKANGVNLAYKVSGGKAISWSGNDYTGRSVIFIHGLGTSSDLWTHQHQHLDFLCQTISYDNRGVGESDKPKDGYDIQNLSKDVIGLMDHLKLKRAVLCGLSDGANVALNTALEYPARVQGLIMCGANPNAADAAEKKTLSEISKLAGSKGLEAAVEYWLDNTPGLQPFFNHHTEQGFLQDEFPTRNWLKKQALRTTPEAFAATVEGMLNRPDFMGKIKGVQAPVLVVIGTKDGPEYVKAADQMAGAGGDHRGAGTTTATGFRDVNKLVLPTAGHYGPLERTEEFNERFQDYLQALEGSAYDHYQL
jgi:pimeloyl-ACP methyl ester carboxylesterase